MAIRKIGDSYQIDYYDPSGKRIRKNFKFKKDAVAELGKRQSLMREDRYLDRKREYTTTLKQLADKYADIYQDQTSYQTAKRYFIKAILKHFGNDTRLSEIKYIDVEAWRQKMQRTITRRGQFASAATINRHLACLRHMFSKAITWDMIDRSPFDAGEGIMLKEENKRLRFLSEDEIQRLLAECRGYLRDLVEAAILTGCRRGELLSLKWDQIRQGFIYLDKTKTGEGRQIPVSDALDRLFKQIRARDQLKSEYVFTYHGHRVKEIKTAFRAAVRRAGIDDFKFHDLRHTFASQVLIKGGSLKDVQELLGHKSMSMTLRYAHLSHDRKKAAVNLLSGLTGKTNSHKMVTPKKNGLR